MLFEISVIPLGKDIHLSDELGEVLSVIDRSGLPYLLGPGSITLIKVEDDEGQHGKLKSNVRSVEEKAGRPLETEVEPAVEGDASPGV